MVTWYLNGADADKVPSVKDEGRGCLIVFTNGRCFTYVTASPHADECFAPDAWGSGYQYAIGAMKAGADARRAVEVAIDCDVETGGRVQTVDLT